MVIRGSVQIVQRAVHNGNATSVVQNRACRLPHLYMDVCNSYVFSLELRSFWVQHCHVGTDGHQEKTSLGLGLPYVLDSCFPPLPIPALQLQKQVCVSDAEPPLAPLHPTMHSRNTSSVYRGVDLHDGNLIAASCIRAHSDTACTYSMGF